MKRRKRAAVDQQRWRRAARRPTQRSAVADSAALSPAVCLDSTRCSSASAASQQVDSIQPAILRLSALERVSPDALVLVLQYLTARHKLAAVSRLSRAFRPLPALAFKHDPIDDVLPGYTDVWDDASTAKDRLSTVCLTVKQPEQAGRSTLFSCPRSLRALPNVSALQVLYIYVHLPGCADWTASLRSILRSVLPLPSLTTLTVSAMPPYPMTQLPEVDWTDSALPSAFSLRLLFLEKQSMSAASFCRLCFSSVTSLYMNGCCLLPAPDDTALVNAQQTVSGSSSALRKLTLPKGEDGVRILQQYVSATQHSGSGLQQLTCRGSLGGELLSLVALHLQQLQQLSLTLCVVGLRSGPALDFSPLMTASHAPRLPHLSELSLPLPVNDSSADWQPELMQAFTTASQQLVAAYSAQLTSLYVTVLSASTISPWLSLVFARCRHLKNLRIKQPKLLRAQPEPPLELPSEPATAANSLDSLSRLVLHSLPLTDGSLLSLFSRCPKLSACWLGDLPYVTKAGEEAAFRCCPELRKDLSAG